jgi:predicted nucleic acid-binding protein
LEPTGRPIIPDLEAIQRLLRERKRHGQAHSLVISIISFGELAVGFQTPHELERLLGRIRVIMLHKHIAWEASRIRREARKMLNQNDYWIATTARASGQKLVSNDEDFDAVPLLTRVTY